MKIKFVLCLFLAAACVIQSVSAQNSDGDSADDPYYYDGEQDSLLGMPLTISIQYGRQLSADSFIDGNAVGCGLRLEIVPHFFIQIEYLFLAVRYYWFDHSTGAWSGPGEWSDVVAHESGDISQGDWLFYATEHFLAPEAGLIIPLGPINLEIAVGPGLTFTVPSDAVSWYPDFSEEYFGDMAAANTYLGMITKIGARIGFIDFMSVALDYVFIVRDFTAFGYSMVRDPLETFGRASAFILSVGFTI